MTTSTGNVAQFTTVDDAPDESWFITFMDRANALPEYARARRQLAEDMGELDGATVLDVGCGTGDDARELAALVGPAGLVIGTDLSAAMIEVAQQRSAGSDLPVEFRVDDGRAISFDDQSFDAVRAKLMLMHCENIPATAAELVRVTKIGGRVVAFDYDFDTTTIDHPDLATTREIIRTLSDGHNSWCGRQLRRRFLELGLADVTVAPQTVLMPFDFYRMVTAGRLAAAQAAGDLKLTADQLAAWWEPLIEAQAQGRFFQSITGFVVGGTRVE
ncbi:methyltransferase domain-containing protein [Longispora sp. K20-0274]|uniref:methyltransferase domain-containing protein n=1 Tax=Longispora sp. K20-0274 TaxID=3088255 RepID=UPI00399A7E25